MFIQTPNIKSAAADLELMLNDLITKGSIIVPIGKNTFKYKNYLVIRDQNCGWSVLLVQSNKKQHIASTFLKVSAFAICKAHDKKKFRVVEEIKLEDKIFERNYIDSLFFKNIYKTSTEWDKKDVAYWRLEIVHNKAIEAKRKIDRIFYSSIV